MVMVGICNLRAKIKKNVLHTTTGQIASPKLLRSSLYNRYGQNITKYAKCPAARIRPSESSRTGVGNLFDVKGQKINRNFSRATIRIFYI